MKNAIYKPPSQLWKYYASHVVWMLAQVVQEVAMTSAAGLAAAGVAVVPFASLSAVDFWQLAETPECQKKIKH